MSERRGNGSRWRRLVQAVSAALFLACFVLAATAGGSALPVDLYFLVDPLLGLSALAAGRELLPAAMLAGAGLLLATAVGGRFFCGYLCPMGALLDLSSPRLKRRRRAPRWIKYVVLAAVLAAALGGLPAAWLLDPLAVLWRGLALAVYPLLLWTGDAGLDVLRLATEPLWESSPFAIGLTPRLFAGAGLSLGLLAAVVALNFLAPRFWCRAVCPLGALLGIAARTARLRRRTASDKCIACRRCAEACPMGAIGDDLTVPASECLLCLRCVEECPRGAIQVAGWGLPGPVATPALQPLAAAGQTPPIARVPARPTRRQILGTAVCGLAGALVLDRSVWADGDEATVLRPPGSLPEDDFLNRCLRCGVCFQACPTNVIQPDVLPAAAAGLFAPRLDMTRGGCDPECNACGAVCPSAAIAPLRLDEKKKALIGRAVVERDNCLRGRGLRGRGLRGRGLRGRGLRGRGGEDCRVCVEACPFDAVELRPHGGELWPVVSAELCNGCGLCEFRCPRRPAIRVVPLAQAARFPEPPVDETRDEDHLPPFLRGS